jgi:hypothetical protein
MSRRPYNNKAYQGFRIGPGQVPQARCYRFW